MKLNVKSDECLKTYLKELNNMPVLEHQEIIALGRMSKSGDLEARRILILGHLRFVVSLAKKQTGGGLSLADLICWGNIGLLEAVKKYDPDHVSASESDESPLNPNEKKAARHPLLLTTYSKSYIEKYMKKAKKACIGKPSEKDYGEDDSILDVFDWMEKEYPTIDLNSAERRKNRKEKLFAWSDDLPSYIPDPADTAIENEVSNDLIKILAETLDPDEKKYIMMYFGISMKPMYEWDIAAQCNADILVVAKTINAALVKLNKSKEMRELREGLRH